MATLDDVFGALKKIRSPLGGPDIFTAGWVRDVSLEGKRAVLTLKLPNELRGKEGNLIAEIELKLRGLGLKEVVIDRTFAETRREKPAPEEPRSIPGVNHLIGVASGKGGVGKSTVAVNLAVIFKKLGFSVGLMDGDIYGPSIPKMMGLEGGLPPLMDNKIQPLEQFGVKVLSIGFLVEEDMAVIWRGPLIHKAYEQFFFQTNWGQLDFLILDLPPGTGDPQISATKLAKMSGGIVVTTPQDVALSDVRKAITMFRTMEVPVLGVIENMSYFVCPHCRKITRIFGEGGGRRLSEEMGIPFLGEIPLDPSMTKHGDMGRPTVLSDPEGDVARALTNIAEKLKEELS